MKSAPQMAKEPEAHKDERAIREAEETPRQKALDKARKEMNEKLAK
ncbi:hypothetical protein [Klebsiella pneumoniae]